MTKEETKKTLSDIGSERAVLAGVCQFGKDAFYEVCDLIEVATFTVQLNQYIYKCLEELFKTFDKVDVATLAVKAGELNLSGILNSKEAKEHIASLFVFPITIDNVRTHAKKLAKLEFARKSQEVHVHAWKQLHEITGQESIDEIMNISQDKVFDLYKLLNGKSESNPDLFSSHADGYVDKVLQEKRENIGIPSPFPIFNQVIGGGMRNGGVTLFGARPKCLDLNTVVYTHIGPKLIKDVNVGDLLCHPNGGYTKVLHTNLNTDSVCYEITFSDNTKIICTAEHRWKVKCRRRKEHNILTTEEMIEQGLYYNDRPKYEITTTDFVTFDARSLVINPYTLGVLIGDGGITENVSFTTADQFILNQMQALLLINHKIKTTNKYGYRISAIDKQHQNQYLIELNNLGLFGKKSNKKFIPNIYKYNSIENRIQLIQGLFDTDGHVSKNGKTIEYSTKSLQLALDVKEVLESLGCLVTKKRRITKCLGKRFYSYRLHVKSNNNAILFRLPRKKNRCKKRTKRPLHRKIVKIKQVPTRITKCVTVDRTDELFLVNGFIATKNSGKSSLAINIGLHVSGLGIPVLYLDTEMDLTSNLSRILANVSGLDTNAIERGQVNELELRNAAKKLRDLRFFHKSIAGKKFSEVLSTIRRWIIRAVGYDNHGKTNPCLIIYDYFKIMDVNDLNDLAEYQAIGFQVSKLADFTKEYDFPCVAFVQLNRDGITKDTSDIISQSDRLLWLCTSCSILKRKTPEEIALDGPANGNTKLKPLQDGVRFGPGMEFEDYINIDFQRDSCRMSEVNTRFMLNKQNQGFDGKSSGPVEF